MYLLRDRSTDYIAMTSQRLPHFDLECSERYVQYSTYNERHLKSDISGAFCDGTDEPCLVHARYDQTE